MPFKEKELKRTIYPEVPPRVEYALTGRSRSLLPHLNALIEWAMENKDAILTDRQKAMEKKMNPCQSPSTAFSIQYTRIPAT